MVKAMAMAAAVSLAALGAEQVAAQNGAERATARPLGSTGQGIFDPQPAKQNCIELSASLMPPLPRRVVCKVEIEVADLPRCAPKIEPGALIIRHATYANVDRSNFRVRWVLKGRTAGTNLNNLSFAPEVGIEILQEADSNIWAFNATEPSDDEGEPAPSTLPIHRVRASSNQSNAATKPAAAYHYNINILRYSNLLRQWVPCGGIDPLIVNTD